MTDEQTPTEAAATTAQTIDGVLYPAVLLPAANLGPTHRMRYQAVVGATPIIHRISVGMQLIQWQPN